MTTTAVSDREREAWLGLIALTQRVPPALDNQLAKDSAATHYEYFVLSRLAETSAGRMRLSALAAATNASMSRLSHVITRLETRGLVLRMPCPEDGRATNAVLTDAGSEFVKSATPGHLEKVRQRLLGSLSADQVDQLADISAVLLRSLDPDSLPSDVCQVVVDSTGAP